MRITYRQLQRMLNALSSDQLDCDVTVELSGTSEAYAADFRIVGPTNDTGLENNHPVIFCHYENPDRATDTEVDDYIASWADKNAKVSDE
jgi:hypothetical protein